MRKLLPYIAGIVAIFWLGCSDGHSPRASSVASKPPSSIIWMFGEDAISTVAADAKASHILAGRKIYIILTTVEPLPFNPPAVPAGWTPTWIYRWTSQTQMALDFTTGSVPPWVTVAMYDNELATAPATPLFETDNPPLYTRQAASVAHAGGKIFWMTAGLQTSNASYPGGQAQEVADEWATSSSWDGYAIQSQTAINDIPTFFLLITANASNATASATKPLNFSAGIGDFSNGTFAPLSQNEAAVPTIPSGYAVWMNFGPHSGPGCTDTKVCPIPARFDMIASLIDYFN